VPELRNHSRLRRLVAALVLGLVTPVVAGAQDTTSDALRTLIATARHPWARWPDFALYVADVSRLYRAPADTLLWHTGSRLSQAGYAAIHELVLAGEHGLAPQDYDAAMLDGLAARAARTPLDPAARSRFDLLLTVDFLRYLDDLRRGRLHPNPLGPRGSDALPVDLAAAVRGAIEGDSVAALVSAMEPRLVQYHALLAALARYRRLTEDSFPPLPAAGTVRPGDRYPGIAALKQRLIAFGDLAADGADGGPPDRYGEAVVEAVRRFQLRHGLTPDGILGRATFGQLAVPLAWRVRQIELALERVRWLPPLDGKRILVVNIPAFELFGFDSAGRTGSPSIEMKVIVGRALDRHTPILFEEMRYVEFWPSWNVPRSIVLGEILPELRKRPDYLRANRMELVGARGASAGDRVSPRVLARLERGELGVRQQPGPTNPLGLVKFVLPNAADVYLHGTPLTELFSRVRRDFSHGCIRVEQPVELADWVLGDQAAWPPDSIDAALRGPQTTRAPLAHALPVAIFYTTTVVRPDGSIWFYDDLYSQDRALDEALQTRTPLPPEPIAEAVSPH
jgi:murein L,D-transpeptidase YcbB/YkuD